MRQSLTDWMSWLKSELGFMGWRFDFTKGFGANFVGDYIRDTGFGEAFNVGEFWTDLRSAAARIAPLQSAVLQSCLAAM